MKNYRNSDYAANKKSKNIVYKSDVSKDVDITLEKFLASDPSLTEADFEFWKNWSDNDYEQNSRDTNRITKKEVSIENLLEAIPLMSLPLEEEYEEREIERLQKAAIAYAMFHLYSDISVSNTTLNRFDSFIFEGKSKTEIAKGEQVDEKAIRKSLLLAKRKLTKWCKEYLCENACDY